MHKRLQNTRRNTNLRSLSSIRDILFQFICIPNSCYEWQLQSTAIKSGNSRLFVIDELVTAGISMTGIAIHSFQSVGTLLTRPQANGRISTRTYKVLPCAAYVCILRAKLENGTWSAFDFPLYGKKHEWYAIFIGSSNVMPCNETAISTYVFTLCVSG